MLQLFPVLGNVPWLPPTPRPLTSRADLRHRGFKALKALLRSIAARTPLVLSIEDLQWSDADSGRLLGALFCTDDPVPMLLLGTQRASPAQLVPAFDELAFMARFAPAPPLVVELDVCDLPDAEVRQLLAASLPTRSEASQPGKMGLATQGSPLRELSGRLAEHDDAFGRAPPSSLDAMLQRSLERLSAHGRAVLEVLVIAGSPLTASIIELTIEDGLKAALALSELRREGLSCETRTRHGSSHVLAFSQLASVVLRHLGADRRVALHLRLARALEREPGEHNAALVTHFLAAHIPQEAARCALQGARAALNGLAFARAAQLFEVAIRVGSFARPARAGLYQELASALERAGRGVDAATAYVEAARCDADLPTRAQCLQRAALQLLYNGCHDRGEALVRAGYEALGIPWPRGSVSLGLSGIARLIRPALRALGLRARSASAEQSRARAEFCAVVGRALPLVAPLRSAYNVLVCFDEAEQLDDPVWAARVRGARGLIRCLSRSPWQAQRGLTMLRAACGTATSLGDVSAEADLRCQLATAYFIAGEPRASLDASERAIALLRAQPSAPMDLHAATGVNAFALVELGELHEVRRRLRCFADEARMYGDLTLCAWIYANPARLISFLAGEERASAEAIVSLLQRMRHSYPRCSVLAWELAASRVECALYWRSGGEAHALAGCDRGALFGLAFGAFSRKVRLIRARTRLAYAAELPCTRARSALVRAAIADAPMLRSDAPFYRGLGSLLGAGGQLLMDRPDAALAGLDTAITALDTSGAKLVAASARYCKGLVLGGDVGRSLQSAACDTLRAEGIVDAKRWVGWTTPGFRVALGALP